MKNKLIKNKLIKINYIYIYSNETKLKIKFLFIKSDFFYLIIKNISHLLSLSIVIIIIIFFSEKRQLRLYYKIHRYFIYI